MIFEILYNDLFRYGQFDFGITGGLAPIDMIKEEDEGSNNPTVTNIGECFRITIGLFFITIIIGLHVKFKEK